MQCPTDGTELTMAERQGVEIDYCPKCRGVWLDRGELDKIIERSSAFEESPRRDPRDRYGQHEHDDPQHRGRHGRKRKRESFLSELFDF